MIELVAWIGVALSLLGSLLTSFKQVLGWWIWLAADVFWLAWNWYMGYWAQVFLFSVYCIICIWAIYNWGHNE